MSDLDQMMIDEEGYREKPYRDTLQLWTVGIGFCLERASITAEDWKHLLDCGLIDVKLSKVGALYLMRKRMDAIEIGIPRLFTSWHALNQVRRHVLMSMAYQMGLDGLADFKKMRAAIDRGDWDEAERQGLDSLWARQTPARAKRHMLQLKRGV